MLIVSWIFSFIFIALIIFLIINDKKDKKYEYKIKKSLEDEFIIEPDTGIKLTLEEAESGHWISHDNENKAIPKSEIEIQICDGQKTLATLISYLRESNYYQKSILTEKQLDILAETKTLSKYDDWSYSNAYTFDKGILVLIEPVLYRNTYFQEDYCETQILFWLKIDNIKGHYYLREKTFIEKILDKFRKDDCLQLRDYESFTFKKSYNLIMINNVLKFFENQKGLQIEFNNDNLFIKTLRLANLEDLNRIERIIKNVG